jgi:hypothetical protein
MKAHRLALATRGGWMRAQGRSLAAHLIGTASVAVHFEQPLQGILIMMVHSILWFGEVTRGGKLVQPDQDTLKRLFEDSGAGFSEQAIDILLHWKRRPEPKLDSKGSITSLSADYALMYAINQLDEYLDLYLVGFEVDLPEIPTQLLQGLGAPALAHAIEQARDELYSTFYESPEIWEVAAHHDHFPGNDVDYRLEPSNRRKGFMLSWKRAKMATTGAPHEINTRTQLPLNPDLNTPPGENIQNTSC